MTNAVPPQPEQPLSAQIAPPGKALLCQADFSAYPSRQLWLQPGKPQPVTDHENKDENLYLVIRYDRQLFDDGFHPDPYTVVLTPVYNCTRLDLKAPNHQVDLRYIDGLYLVLREHNLDHRGRPTETLVEICRVPLTEAMPL